MHARLYTGHVIHRRLHPVRHGFTYRVFSLFLDLHEASWLARRLWLFSHNRFNLFSFYDRDHGDGSGRPVADWAADQLRAAGLVPGPIRLLCFPRILGYVFNPLAVYFCYAPDGRHLQAIIYQVSNTFGERHSYLIRNMSATGEMADHSYPKGFHVSPFLAVAGDYHFSLSRPGESLDLAIRLVQGGRTVLIARQSGHAEVLTDGRLLRRFFSHPLMTLKVIAAIHVEALRLWRKGAPVHHKPPAPIAPLTIVDRMTTPTIESGAIAAMTKAIGR